MKYQGYIGSYTYKNSKGIYYFTLENEKLDVKLVAECENPSFLCISNNKKYLYACLETGEYKGQAGGAVIAYKINQDMSLTLLNEQHVLNGGPCHVVCDKNDKHLICSNFSGGFGSIFEIDDNGFLSPAKEPLKQIKSNIDKNTVSRLHQALFNEQGTNIIFTDFGFDRIQIYNYSVNEGVLNSEATVDFPLKSGPRHSVLYKNQYVYTCTELSNKVYMINLNNNGKPTIEFEASTLKEDVTSYCGTIRLFDEKIAISNRGENTLSLFNINKDYSLSLINNFKCGGDFPRDFNVTADNKYILVANQKSNSLNLLKYDNGEIVDTKVTENIDDVVCVEFYN